MKLLKADREPLVSSSVNQERARYPGIGMLVLVWAFIGAAASLRGVLSHTLDIRNDFVYWMGYIACYLPWGFFTALTFRLEERFPLGSFRWLRNTTILVLVSLPSSLAAAPFMRFSFAATMYLLGQPVPFTRPLNHLLSELLIGEFFFWLSVAGGYSIRTRFQLQQQKERAMQLTLEKSLLQASLNQAQLDVLRAKLNPHFLFNSLQNISSLTRQDPLIASRMLAKLGDLLRAVLRTDSQTECTLEDEIDLLKHYMALEQMRFGDRLDFELDIESEAKRALVPSFILQPLVENAIVHGLREARRDGIVSVQATVLSDTLTIKVRDNGTGLRQSDKKSKNGGLGLSSTRERLMRMYPDRHHLSISSPSSKGTEIRIDMPFLTASRDERSPEEFHASVDR